MKRHLLSLVAACAIGLAAPVHAQNVGLAAFTSSGALDTTFGTNGTAVSAFPGIASGLAVDSKGRLVVVGTSSGPQIVLARYRPGGRALDTHFGNNGFVITSITGGATGRAVAIADGDAIVVAGEANGQFAVLRFDKAGVLRIPLNCPPVTSADRSGEALALTIAADGSIVAAGARPSFDRVLVARYTAEGCQDPSFVWGLGINSIDASQGAEATWQAGKAVAIDGSGRILVGGPLWSFTSGVGGVVCMAVIRLGDSGFVDSSYGSSGVACAAVDVTRTPAPFDDAANSMVVRNGHAWLAGNYQGPRLARFDVNGINTLLTSAITSPRALMLTHDGSALLVGGWRGSTVFGVTELRFSGNPVPIFGQSGSSTVDVDCTMTNYIAGIANQNRGVWRIVVAGPSGASTCQ